MNRTRILQIAAIIAFLASAPMGWAVSVTPEELAAAHRWSTATFQGVQPPRTAEPALVVLANNDPVQKNARAGKPMHIADKEYTRGLFCHAFSKIIVRLPSPGTSFSAIVGVDSNEQTSGGRGSVDFSVSVGGVEKFRSGVMREGRPGKPVTVDLGGASEFVIQVDETPDGIPCDQADWVEAKVKLADGRELWLADLPLREGECAPYSTEPPFSFLYDGKSSAELLKTWKSERRWRNLDSRRTERTLTWKDSATGLHVRCVAVEYGDFPTVEWTLYFKNTGGKDTPILSDVLALDSTLTRNGGRDFLLHHHKGTFVRADDFEPLTTMLKPNDRLRFAPPAGRPLGHVFPYFNLEQPANEGIIAVVGWPGQWFAEFARDKSTGLRVIAGQEKVRLRLKPGEDIRTPLIVLQFWRGDWIRAQNIWRRWMVTDNIPRPNGQPPRPLMTPCSSHQFAEMTQANEANQKLFIDRYLEEKFSPDYWWMDAGWYPCDGAWQRTGTWEVDTKRFPKGLRAISDHAHAKGVKTIVWFEPERVHPDTWLTQHHPEWVLGGKGGGLLNLGNPDAWKWLVEHVDKLITQQGIDVYRQDYNIDPLAFWRGADTADRQGITENHHVTGYLAYWDELLKRHPGMLIDTCASGGHRNDLETLRRSLPFLRSDFILNAVGNQGHTYGLSFWMPYHGTGAGHGQRGLYDLRSALACPHFIAAWDVRDRTLDYDFLRKTISDWRGYAPNYLGDYYPLLPYTTANDAWLAWQFDRPEAGQGVVQAFRRAGSSYESARFRLRGLEANARYVVTDLDRPATPHEFDGRELLEHGLLVAAPDKPSAIVLIYQQLRQTK